MRWISKEDIEECLTAQWRASASAALKEITEAPTLEIRKQILKKVNSSEIWRNFYKLLPLQLKKKCWYCEAEEIRSDMPIDHFRPKNKVDDDRGHEGYWWLAFDWENYRCACTFCNSRRNFEESVGGKACRFPLVDPLKRAYGPSENFAEEVPDFLDPFDPDDWKHLWFDSDGIPEPNPRCNDTEKRKVENSIEIFHLHESRIVKKRNSIRIDIERAIKSLRKAETETDVITQRQLKSHLMKMVKDTAMHSRAAIVYLTMHRDLKAVKEILSLD